MPTRDRMWRIAQPTSSSTMRSCRSCELSHCASYNSTRFSGTTEAFPSPRASSISLISSRCLAAASLVWLTRDISLPGRCRRSRQQRPDRLERQLPSSCYPMPHRVEHRKREEPQTGRKTSTRWYCTTPISMYLLIQPRPGQLQTFKHERLGSSLRASAHSAQNSQLAQLPLD